MCESLLDFVRYLLFPRKLRRIAFFVRLVAYLLFAYWLLFNSPNEFYLINSLVVLGYFLPFVAAPRARDCGLPLWMIFVLLIPVFSAIPLIMLLFTRSHLSDELPKQETPIPFRKHLWWMIGFMGIPWSFFFLTWIVNPAYTSKFFKPVEGEWWLGTTMLFMAIGLSLMTYPLSIQFQRLRLIQERTWTTTSQMVMLVLVNLALSLMVFSILILTPAAFTMMEQMKAIHQDE